MKLLVIGSLILFSLSVFAQQPAAPTTTTTDDETKQDVKNPTDTTGTDSTKTKEKSE